MAMLRVWPACTDAMFAPSDVRVVGEVVLSPHLRSGLKRLWNTTWLASHNSGVPIDIVVHVHDIPSITVKCIWRICNILI